MGSGRYYPVVLEFTEHRVVLVEADSAADALDSLKDDDLSDMWSDADQCDVLDGLGLSDSWTTRSILDLMEREEVGPHEACPECGVVAHYLGDSALQFARHQPTCSAAIHHVSHEALWETGEDGRRDIVGWYVSCSCGEPGFTRHYGDDRDDRSVIEAHGRRVFAGDMTDDVRSELSAIAQAHVAGRPHWKNLPLGIADDLRHSDPRRRLAVA